MTTAIDAAITAYLATETLPDASFWTAPTIAAVMHKAEALAPEAVASGRYTEREMELFLESVERSVASAIRARTRTQHYAENAFLTVASLMQAITNHKGKNT